MHDDHRDRYPCRPEACLFGFQQQECFAETREGQERRRDDDDPDRPIEFRKIGEPEWLFGFRSCGRIRLLHTGDEDEHRKESGNDRDPENGEHIFAEREHQPDGRQRPDEAADRIERLSEPECGATNFRRRHIGNKSVARRSANALSDPVHRLGGDDPAKRGGEGKSEFRDCAETVSKHGEHFPPPRPVRDNPGKQLGRGGDGNRHSLDETDSDRGSAETGNEIIGQQRLHHFRRNIHQKANDAEHPDRRWNACPNRRGNRRRRSRHDGPPIVSGIIMSS